MGSIASRNVRSWRDDDERAVVRAQRLLELLDGLEVEVIRRLVEHEEVHLARLQLGQVRPCPLTRRERRPRARDVVGAETELREQRPRIDGGEACCSRRRRRGAALRRARRAPVRSCRSPSSDRGASPAASTYRCRWNRSMQAARRATPRATRGRDRSRPYRSNRMCRTGPVPAPGVGAGPVPPTVRATGRQQNHRRRRDGTSPAHRQATGRQQNHRRRRDGTRPAHRQRHRTPTEPPHV